MGHWKEASLSPAAKDLLVAIDRGVRVRWTGPWYPKAGFYRRWDNGQVCTAAAQALLAAGLVDRCNERGSRGTIQHDLERKRPAGEAR
ncbi:MAG: hypothetical protein F9K47_14910 [Burkholderiales bacterium]|nr:MAG: hypothetical protein F9K47_14910 [Burkholderiales bacterium]